MSQSTTAAANFIALDVHKAFCQMIVISSTGRVTRRLRLPTAIPDLVEAIRRVRGPRRLTFEEGPLADWLVRNLAPHVDELLVCEPRRNRLVAEDEDKTDPIDAEKLAQLHRGGYLKPVHQRGAADRSALKQTVALYHDQVRRRVAVGNKLVGLLARQGVLHPTARGLLDETAWREALADVLEHRPLRSGLARLRDAYLLEVEHERIAERELVGVARNVPEVRRFATVPGIAWIRGLTFYVEIDTPWRFRNKSALCKYCGLGLKRRQSGRARPRTVLSRNGNRRLKNVLIGAAETCIQLGDNPYAEKFRSLREKGDARSQARRTVARQLATTLSSLWKTGREYDPERVRRTATDPEPRSTT